MIARKSFSLKVIPEKFISRVLVDKNELEKNVRLTGIFSSNISDIKIKCQEGKLCLVAKNSDRGEIESEVESVLKNEPFELSLNFHYLLDGLKVINSPKVIIEFTGQNSPLVLRQGDGGKDVVYLIYKVNLGIQLAPSVIDKGSLILKGASKSSVDVPVSIGKQKDESGKVVGRNDPCPCGSGKKYKRCHGNV